MGEGRCLSLIQNSRSILQGGSVKLDRSHHMIVMYYGTNFVGPGEYHYHLCNPTPRFPLLRARFPLLVQVCCAWIEYCICHTTSSMGGRLLGSSDRHLRVSSTAVLIDWYAYVPLIERSIVCCIADADSARLLSSCNITTSGKVVNHWLFRLLTKQENLYGILFCGWWGLISFTSCFRSCTWLSDVIFLPVSNSSRITPIW